MGSADARKGRVTRGDGLAVIASAILATVEETEQEFLNDLFEAKLKYMTTRPYWSEPQAKPKLY